jgi:hypothetical protein
MTLNATGRLALAIGLAGWATLACAGLFSTSGPVIAIVADELFIGEATGYLNGTGTVAIQSQTNAGLRCVGRFTSDSSEGGTGQMSCSDGSGGSFDFKRMRGLRGYGGGSSTRGLISFVFGLKAADAIPFLRLPQGKKLTLNGTKLELASELANLP